MEERKEGTSIRLADNLSMSKTLDILAMIRDVYENSDDPADQEMIKKIDESIRNGINLVNANVSYICEP